MIQDLGLASKGHNRLQYISVQSFEKLSVMTRAVRQS